MHCVASHCLLDLRKQRLRIAHKQVANVLAISKFILQQLDRTPGCVSFELHYAAVEGDSAVHGSEEAECSFAPDIGGLDCGAILQYGQQRENRALRKIRVLEEAAGIADHLTKLELDRLKMGLYPLAAGWLQRAQHLTSSEVTILLCFEH